MKVKTADIAASEQRAEAYSNTLTADYPGWDYVTHVVHEDGSIFHIQNAFVTHDPEDDNFLWVITEHFDELVFDRSEVTITQFETALRKDPVELNSNGEPAWLTGCPDCGLNPNTCSCKDNL